MTMYTEPLAHISRQSLVTGSGMAAQAMTESQWLLYFALELIRLERKVPLGAAISLAREAYRSLDRTLPASAEQAARAHAATSSVSSQAPAPAMKLADRGTGT